MIRILLVDDHALTRLALGQLLSEEPDLVVVGECSDGTQVCPTASSTMPDVVLMDIRMPRMGGFQAARELLAVQPNTKVVLMTGTVEAGSVDDAGRAGAVGFILKGSDPAELIEAIRQAAAGGSAWPPERVPARC